jgi:hypothetical protein
MAPGGNEDGLVVGQMTIYRKNGQLINFQFGQMIPIYFLVK